MAFSALIKGIAKTVALPLGAYLIIKAVKQTRDEYDLTNKVVLITGGTRGLGLVMARRMAEEGANVVICGRSEKHLQRASTDLQLKSTRHLAINCDVSDKQQVRRMIRKVEEEFGPVDVLINNAGIIQIGPMELMNDEDYRDAMNVHFWGPLSIIKEVLPGMIKKKSGRIINIVSIGGKISFPHILPYNVSKHALAGLSEGLTAELSKYGVKVMTVYPGLMRTGSPRNIDVKGQFKKEYAWFKISDSLPLLSMNAGSAAHQIIQAMKRGSKVLTLTLPAKAARALQGLAPELVLFKLELVNYLLPGSPDIIYDDRSRKGYESESKLSRSAITKKTDAAAEHNLELD